MKKGRIGPCHHLRCMGFSTCARCHTYWSHVEPHTVYFPADYCEGKFIVFDGVALSGPIRMAQGFFAVCTECWRESGDEELVVYFRQRYERDWSNNSRTWREYLEALIKERSAWHRAQAASIRPSDPF